MAKVRFPFRVKSGGEYYEAGQVVDVSDIGESINIGGVVVDVPKPEAQAEPERGENAETESDAPRRGRPKNPDMDK